MVLNTGIDFMNALNVFEIAAMVWMMIGYTLASEILVKNKEALMIDWKNQIIFYTFAPVLFFTNYLANVKEKELAIVAVQVAAKNDL